MVYNDTKKFICFCNMRNISQKILKINLVSKKTQNTKVIFKIIIILLKWFKSDELSIKNCTEYSNIKP